MDKDKFHTHSINCTCMHPSHRLCAIQYPGNDIMLTVENGETTLLDRIKTAFNIIFHGVDTMSEVIISNKDAKDLSNWLFYEATKTEKEIKITEENNG